MKPKIKINSILKEKEMSLDDLKIIIDAQNPEFPIGKKTLSQIVNGHRNNYTVFTLLRLCKALKKSPNDILDYELF